MSENHPETTAVPPKNQTILIVEDSAVQAELMRRALHGAGYKVALAKNGDEGLAQARNVLPALILSDVNMPIVDGYQFCKALRQDPQLKTIPVILVTMLSDPNDVLKGIEAGADAYLTKPYNIPALLTWIAKLLSRPKTDESMDENGEELLIDGKLCKVRVGTQRMMSLMLSIYENAVQQNKELQSTQEALKDLNATLEHRVYEQTAAIRDSEVRLQALIEHASDAVIVVDKAGVITFAGPSIEQICGMKPEVKVGERFLDFIHPDDQSRIETILDSLVKNPHKFHTFEQRVKHVDGHWVIVETNAKNALSDKAVGGLVLNLRDVSARKEAEKDIRKLSMAIDQNPDGICITDTQGKVEYANNAFCTSSAFGANVLSGMNIRELETNILSGNAFEDIWAVLKEGKVWRGEMHIQGRNDAEIVYETVFAPIRQEDGTISNYVSVQKDITAQHAMEQELDLHRLHLEELVKSRTAELVEAQERAEEANRSKSEFLANMSHEIRTPMNAIIGLTHMLRRGNPTPHQNDSLIKISAAADHLLSVINDILDLSKIEAGKLQLEQIDFDPEQIVENVCNMIQPKVQEKGLELLANISVLPANVRGDGMRVQQILLNFASNAIKFTETGEIVFRVWMQEASDKGVGIRFEVSDTGIGMTQDQQSRLFKPFEQADASTTRKFGGTGLGLAISLRMVELMGGKIGVTSIPGEGSTFWIEICFEYSDNIPPSSVAGLGLYGKRALVVTKLPSTQKALTGLLKMLGINVTVAVDGKALLETAASSQQAGGALDLVMIDSELSDMDGLELGRHLCEKFPDKKPPMLLMTRYGESPHDDMLHCHGFVGHIQKPVTPARFTEKMQEVLLGAGAHRPGTDKSGAVKAEDLLRLRKGVHVLLAEDNPVNQEVALDLLQDVGITVELAENGKLALDKAAANAYDLILMDMQMPVMDGIEATHQIRNLPTGKIVPILAMTANAFDEDRERCVAAGMNDHIAKPVNPRVLYETLLRWLPATKTEPEKGVPAEDKGQGGPAAEFEPLLSQLQRIDGLDVDEGLKNTNGKPELYYRVLGRFINNPLASQLTQAVNEGNVRDAFRVAHTLKGVTSTVGAKPLCVIATEINNALTHMESDSSMAGLKADVAGLEQAFVQLTQAIAEVLPHSDERHGPVKKISELSLADVELLKQLEGCIATDEFTTASFYNSNLNALRSILGELSNQIESEILNFDFEAAMSTLRSIRQSDSAEKTEAVHSSQHLDYAKLNTLFRRPEALKRILQKIVDHHASDAERLRAAEASQDWPACFNLAHAIKGMSGQIGDLRLQEAAAVADSYWRKGEAAPEGTSQQLIDQLAGLLEEIKLYLADAAS